MYPPLDLFLGRRSADRVGYVVDGEYPTLYNLCIYIHTHQMRHVSFLDLELTQHGVHGWEQGRESRRLSPSPALILGKRLAVGTTCLMQSIIDAVQRTK